MDKRERDRKKYCLWGKGYYHLSTDGWQEGRLFNTVEEYAYAMLLVGLITLKYTVTVYSFELMPNHIHILLSGKGEDCVKSFDFLKRKISARLMEDEYMPLPKDYWFKLTPVETEDQMRDAFIYIARNSLEKGLSVPGCYPWGTGMLYYSAMSSLMEGRRVADMSGRETMSLSRTHLKLPGHWLFHPVVGLLPISFVNTTKVYKLFSDMKDYLSHLVKDYEAVVRVARSIGEQQTFSKEEVDDMVEQMLATEYRGRKLRDLSQDEKGRLAVILFNRYTLTPEQISRSLMMSEHIVNQLIRSKDYGKYK